MNAQYLSNVWNRLLEASPAEVAWGLLSSPVVCAVLGVAVALFVARVRRGAVVADRAPRGERVAAGGIALAVGVVWVVDIVLRGYVFDMSDTVSWWRFSVAPIAAASGLTILASAMRARAPRRAVDPASMRRRTWTTFGPLRGIPLFVVVVGVTIAVAVVFGRTSTSYGSGLAAHVALELPNVDAPRVVTIFPGWAYGIPLIVSVLTLTVAVFSALRRNAVRPFPAAVSLDVERARRAEIARDVVGIGIGATSIVLGGMLRMARAAVATTITTTSESGGVSNLSVSLPHADLVLGGGVVAPLLEIGGLAILVLLVVRSIRVAQAPTRPTAEVRA